MYQNLKSLVMMSLCLAALTAAAGCQAGSPLELDDEAGITTIYQETPEGTDVDLLGGPWVTQAPPQPKEGSDWFDLPDFDPDIFEAIFSGLHIPLVSGLNEDLDYTDYMAASANVSEAAMLVGYQVEDTLFGEIIIPEWGTGVKLDSAPGTMSYVTYGFKNIPAGEQIVGIDVDGVADFDSPDHAGLYIGVSDFGAGGGYRWFGPFGEGSDFALELPWMDTTNSQQRAYVTLAVYNGDDFAVTGLNVEVDTLIDIPDWEFELPDFGF